MFEFTLKTFYKCKVCNNELLFYRSNIREHVRKYHKMLFTEYASQYMNAFVADDIKKEEEDELEIDKEDGLIKGQIRIKKELTKETKESKENICRVKCTICQRKAGH